MHLRLLEDTMLEDTIQKCRQKIKFRDYLSCIVCKYVSDGKTPEKAPCGCQNIQFRIHTRTNAHKSVEAGDRRGLRYRAGSFVLRSGAGSFVRSLPFHRSFAPSFVSITADFPLFRNTYEKTCCASSTTAACVCAAGPAQDPSRVHGTSGGGSHVFVARGG